MDAAPVQTCSSGAFSSLQTQLWDRAARPRSTDTRRSRMPKTGSSAPCPGVASLPAGVLGAAGEAVHQSTSAHMVQSSLPLYYFWKESAGSVPTKLEMNSPAVPKAFYSPCFREYQYNRSTQKFFRVLLMANGLGVLLCKSDYPQQLRSAVTFKGFPRLPPPPTPLETSNEQGEAAAQYGTYTLHSYRITASHCPSV